MNKIRITFATIALASASSFLLAADSGNEQPIVEQPTIGKVVGIELRERGALLVEDFKGETIDEEKWRIWHSDPKAVEFSMPGGRFEVRGEGLLQHDGLWSLDPARFKDLTLVANLPKGRLSSDTGTPRHTRWDTDLRSDGRKLASEDSDCWRGAEEPRRFVG